MELVDDVLAKADGRFVGFKGCGLSETAQIIANNLLAIYGLDMRPNEAAELARDIETKGDPEILSYWRNLPLY